LATSVDRRVAVGLAEEPRRPATKLKIRATTARTTSTTIIGTSRVPGLALNLRQPKAIASVALYGLS